MKLKDLEVVKNAMLHVIDTKAEKDLGSVNPNCIADFMEDHLEKEVTAIYANDEYPEQLRVEIK